MATNGNMDYLKQFERIVTGILIVLMSIVVCLTVIDLIWLLIKDIITPPIILLDVNELLDIFSMFLLVLIGIELVETLKLYLHQSSARAEVVILVTLIALSRKVITLDFKETPALTLVGIAALIVALGAAYYIIKKSRPPEST
nr:phosphate-starvation-inducible PsiE family protein [Bdellovibrio sp. CKG001]BFD66204.1 phosphate-starvation-inducible PsiE family protein [Bdellovibrio sp. HAGR004]